MSAIIKSMIAERWLSHEDALALAKHIAGKQIAGLPETQLRKLPREEAAALRSAITKAESAGFFEATLGDGEHRAWFLRKNFAEQLKKYAKENPVHPI